MHVKNKSTSANVRLLDATGGRMPGTVRGGAHLQGSAFGHEHAAGLGVLAEVHRLQLLLQALRLARLRLHLRPQPLELPVHCGVQQQLPHLHTRTQAAIRAITS